MAAAPKLRPLDWNREPAPVIPLADDFAARFDARVISLARTPQRLQQFWDWNRAAGIKPRIFNAIDGRTLNLAIVDPNLLTPGTRSYKPGSVGSALSHRLLWKECAGGDRPFLILEDDVAIRSDLRAVLPGIVAQAGADWDFICLGYNTDTFLEIDVGAEVALRFGFPGGNVSQAQLARFPETRGNVGVARLTNFFGLCAYVLSPRGARNLMERCFPLDGRSIFIRSLSRNVIAGTLDTRINDHLASLNAYACIPPLCLPDNSPAVSTKV